MEKALVDIRIEVVYRYGRYVFRREVGSLPKLTIYVPDDLASDLETLKEADVAISTVCQRAVRGEARRLRLLRSAEDEIVTAARRLTLAGRRREEEFFQEGFARGRKWTLELAEPHELRTMERIINSEPAISDRWEAYDGTFDWLDADEFQHYEENEEWATFLAGFEDGAMQTYHAIRRVQIDDDE